MARRAMRLPKDQLVAPEDRTGTGSSSDDDVEGHGMPLTPPPSLTLRGGPGHGGEAVPSLDDGDDVEGHVINR
jgi:hypothetical protein